MHGGALFDPSGAYRYRLWREWDRALPRVAFVMLNPSTGDGAHDDPTIRRCVAFARAWGFGALDVVNLFAWRATSPLDLQQAAEPVGLENAQHLARAVATAERAVAAWGNGGRWLGAAEQALERFVMHPQPWCLALTKLGEPRHPLYAASDTVGEPFTASMPG